MSISPSKLQLFPRYPLTAARHDLNIENLSRRLTSDMVSLYELPRFCASSVASDLCKVYDKRDKFCFKIVGTVPALKE